MTSINVLGEFFGWCLVISVVFYVMTAASLLWFRGLVQRVNRHIFGISEERVMQESFAFVGRFKLAIIVLFLTPYIALRIMA